MSESSDAHQLRSALPLTWPAFFARHGRFTAVQERAIGPILAGRDVLVVAATASGKTEAVIAPLVERHVLAAPHRAELRVLYLCPTRALVRDLHERLAGPLDQLGVSLAMKTGDTAPVSTRRPPSVLLTTPESTDALLTRAPRLFASLRAVVLDEIHLLDGTARGDHLRCLLARIQRIHDYDRQGQGHADLGPIQDPVDPGLGQGPVDHRRGRGGAGVTEGREDVATTESRPWPPSPQRIALSATVGDPTGVADRYLVDAEIVEVAGGRAIAATVRWMSDLADLEAALAESAALKTLIFCNTRREVEQVATFLRRHLPYEAPVFAHYSNLEPVERAEVETRFAEATVAVCVSSSTLELGIDIGSIDHVVLVGAPHTVTSFLQRIGRGGRRTHTTRVLCLPRTRREELRFAALLEAARGDHGETSDRPDQQDQPAEPDPEIQRDHAARQGVEQRPPRVAPYHFKPSVLVQQVFSLLKQSPTGGLRLADLRGIAPAEVDDDVLARLLGHLVATGYLAAGRLGEWRPGPELAAIADAHEIYANIGGDSQRATVIDAYSGRRLARVDRPRQKGEALLLGGRQVEVAWRSDFTFGIRPSRDAGTDEAFRFHTAPYATPFEMAQAVAAFFGLAAGELPYFFHGGDTWLCHFWGDLYGALLVEILSAHYPADKDSGPIEALGELCLRAPFRLTALPPWSDALADEAAHGLARRVAPYLELGRFQDLLPPDVATSALIAHCNLPRLAELYRQATLVEASPSLREVLVEVV